jgi:hypothetical protein
MQSINTLTKNIPAHSCNSFLRIGVDKPSMCSGLFDMATVKNETGNKYGKLTVISICDNPTKYTTGLFYNCICDCGNNFVAHGVALRRGAVLSCGCNRDESRIKHGDSIKGKRTKEYRTWALMKSRCSNPKDTNWLNYGNRGICVCERWKYSYENFLSDMGRAPSPKHSIERLDVNGNYEPSNCVWVTSKVQSLNTRRTIILEVNGSIIKSLELCEMVNIPYSTFEYYFKIKKLTGQQIFNKFKNN